MSDSDDGLEAWRVRVGEALAAARKRSGLSAVQLSARTRELGNPIHRVAITKLESGDRDITASELVVLALALDTAPIMLLYPGPYAREVELMRGVELTEFIAAQWFSGLHDHVPPAPGANFYDYRHNLAALRNVRTLDELRSRKALLLNIIAGLDSDNEGKAVAAILTGQLTDLEAVIKRYEQDGGDDG
jgi:hypothetical protein